MIEIPLTQGKVALVDDADFAALNLYKWYAKKSDTQWYAVRKEGVRYKTPKCRKKPKDTRKNIRMHNQLMNPQGDDIVHHKNENGLDNQRHNLECCTEAQNRQYAVDAKREKDNSYIPF